MGNPPLNITVKGVLHKRAISVYTVWEIIIRSGKLPVVRDDHGISRTHDLRREMCFTTKHLLLHKGQRFNFFVRWFTASWSKLGT